MSELADLVDQLLDESSARRTPPVSAAPAATDSGPAPTVAQSTRRRSPTTLGRDPVLASGRDLMRTGGPGHFAVTGPSGYGKSRVLTDLCTAARAAGFVVARGRGAALARGEMYRPFAELAAALVRDRGIDLAGPLRPHRAGLATLVPAWAGEEPAGHASPFAVAEAMLALVAATGLPVVLSLDDLHWADAETLDVVDSLARRSPAPCRLLIGSRPDGVAADLLGALERDDALTVWDLGPLTPADAASMCEAVVGGVVPRALTDAVAQRSDGVPQVVEELANGLVRSGALTSSGHGVFELADVGAFDQMPTSHAEAVGLRLATLDEEGLRLARAAALLGREFDAARAAAVTGLGDRGIAGIAELVDRGLVERLSGSRLVDHRFVHSLTREAVLAQLDGEELASLAGLVLDGLGTETEPERRADLALVAGRPATAVRLLREAGSASARRGGFASAERQLRRAVAVAGRDAEPARVDLVEVLARAGRNQAALVVGREALPLLVGPDLARLHLALARVEEAASEPASAAHHLAEARRAGAVSVAYDLVRSRVLLAERRLDEGQGAALDALRHHVDAEQACEALELVARCARTRDEDQAEMLLARLAALAEAEGLGAWQLRALSELGTLDVLRCGDGRRLLAARALAETRGDLVTATVVGYHEAIRRFHGVELDGWEQWLTRLETEATAYRLGDLGGALSVLRVCFLGLAGRRAEAEDQARRSAEVALDPEREASLWGIAHVLLALADDDLPRARAALRRGVAAVAGQEFGDPSPMWGMHALLATLDGAGSGVVADVRRRGAVVNRVNAGLAAWADAILAGREGATDTAAGQAGVAAALLAPAPFYSAIAIRHVLPLAHEQGWADGWSGLASSAATTLLGLGFERPAAALSGARPGDVDGLTARESDVLALVREGLTNAEIGSRLVISPRTVEKHVERLLAKTGTSNRTRLAAWSRSR